MIDEGSHRSSVLVIAAWREGDRFLARVTLSDENAESGKSSVIVSDRQLVLDKVAQWLATLESDVS